LRLRKPILLPVELTPLPAPFECDHCHEVLARFRVQDPKGYVCSWCYLYDVSGIGHKPEFLDFIADVGDERGEPLRQNADGKLASIKDADQLLLGLAITSRKFEDEDAIRARFR